MVETENPVRKVQDALAAADPMVLRGLIYQLTGDEEVEEIELATTGGGFFRAIGPAYESDIAMLRQKAARLMTGSGSAGAEIDPGPLDRLPRSLELAVGQELTKDAVDWGIEEFGLDPWARSLRWEVEPPPARLGEFSVTVIGAGLGGLNAALQLKRAGIPFRVIEKNSDIGGTWLENRYPGIRVDSPSRAYTHIFGVDFDHKYTFCPGGENRRYLDWVADTFDLRDDVTLDTEVRELRWDEATKEWEIITDGPGGRQTLRSKGVVTSVGFLNRPSLPEIDGMEDFSGDSWHTARWPEGADLSAKRVAVIGTGCSGYQMIPELARQAAEIIVFQRRPQWMVPVPGYLSEYQQGTDLLERDLPLFRNFMRFKSSRMPCEFVQLSEVDPDFDDPDAVSERNREQRDASIAFLEEKLGPELAAKMIPPHPVCSGRPVLIDPKNSVLDALTKPHVRLNTEGIKRIYEDGIETKDGSRLEVDVIVYATGFKASDYLFPMTVTGRDGRTLANEWAAEGAQAYRGTMVPGFPNLWMIYGPNTNAGLGVPALHEMSMVFALKCMEHMILGDTSEIEPTDSAFARWNQKIDEGNKRMVWSDPRGRNYYWTESGRSSTMTPLRPEEVWHTLNYPDFADLGAAGGR